jgi:peptide/nickel transport system substrate-binding protein
VKRLLALTTLLVFLLTLTGCGGSEGTANVDEEKELVIAIPEEIEGTDIQQVKWENIVHSLLFQPLVSFDMELKNLVPEGASSFEISQDGTELTFRLPKDAAFSDGSPLKAEDIKNSLERYRKISPYAEDLAPIKEIIVKDPETLVLKLEKSAAYLWPVLTSTYGGTVNAKKAKEIGDQAFNRNAEGSGPATVQEWVQGSHITLKKNENYRTYSPLVENKGPIKFDKITVKFVPDDFTRISELESGNADIIISVPAENVKELEQNSDVQLFKYLQPGISYIAMNTKAEPLNDIKVRTAIALAINKDEIKDVLKGAVLPKYGLLSPAQLCYDEKKEMELKARYGYDQDKAKDLLAQAGYKDTDGDGILEKNGKPLSLTMMVALDFPMLKQAAPVIQAQLKQIGINLELREYESKYIKQAIQDHDFQLAMRSYWWNDPDILYYNFSSSSKAPWINKEWDRLLEDARYIMDMNQRTAKYNEIQEKILSELPVVPLFSEYQHIAVRKSVTGVKVSIDGRIFLNDADKID